MNILFILYNILEIKNGVSNKYIQFIKKLDETCNHNISIIMTKINDNDIKNNILTKGKQLFTNSNIYYVKGYKIPFYDKIKIPSISYDYIKNIIKNKKYIIIFNGEFIWLYDSLIKLKNNNSCPLLLFPTWHTDYESYLQNYFYSSFNSEYIMNQIYQYLENKNFQGIIVTGEYMKQKFEKYTKNIFNANELCIDNFSFLKVDDYHEKDMFNFIFCGRISIEKNIDEIFELLEPIKHINFQLHIIGDGPYLKILKNKYNNFLKKVIYYGEVNYDEIQNIYKKLNNRIFIMCSDTETFGKAPMEAGLTGIPIFIKQSKNIKFMYNSNNAFIFENKYDFIKHFIFFLKLKKKFKNEFIENSIKNIKKYDQKKIFEEWENFLEKQLLINNINDNINNINDINDNILTKINFSNMLSIVKCSIDSLSN